MRRDVTWILIAYAVAVLVALVAGAASPWGHPLAVAFVADLAATVAVFVFSRAFNNSSFYDAYWSVVPPLLALYFCAVAVPDVSGVRQLVVVGLVCWWAVRLTYNWARGWTGLHHEDWRYVDLRTSTGNAYWLVSFVGLHLMPTVQVFLGCLSLYAALAVGTRPLGLLDLVATVVTGGAIALEARAAARRDPRQRRVGLVAPSQLLRRDELLVGTVAVRPRRGAGVLVDRRRSAGDHADVPLREPPADRDAHAAAPPQLRGAPAARVDGRALAAARVTTRRRRGDRRPLVV
jgi:Protein of unknown function (DUF1295)